MGRVDEYRRVIREILNRHAQVLRARGIKQASTM
jgi:hypothetical protein